MRERVPALALEQVLARERAQERVRGRWRCAEQVRERAAGAERCGAGAGAGAGAVRELVQRRAGVGVGAGGCWASAGDRIRVNSVQTTTIARRMAGSSMGGCLQPDNN